MFLSLKAFLWYFGFVHSPPLGNLLQVGFAVHSGNGATMSDLDTGILGFTNSAVAYGILHK